LNFLHTISKYTQISILRKIFPVELRCSMLSERHNGATVAFVILQMDLKNIFILIISFYIQEAVSPVGAKPLAYHYTTNDPS